MNASPSRRNRSTDSVAVFSIVASPSPLSSARHALGNHLLRLRRGHAILLERVAISDRYRSVFHRLAVHRDAERRADLVLTPVSPANSTRLVVEHREGGSQLLRQLVGELRHAVLLHERKDAGFHRRERRRERQHRTSLL